MGTWCSGITPAQHAGGPGLNPQCVHLSQTEHSAKRSMAPACLPWPPACLWAACLPCFCLPACLLSCPPACLSACLPTCLHVCRSAHRLPGCSSPAGGILQQPVCRAARCGHVSLQYPAVFSKKAKGAVTAIMPCVVVAWRQNLPFFFNFEVCISACRTEGPGSISSEGVVPVSRLPALFFRGVELCL